jgi:tetratricopeptide (TPR) repeat protein
MRISDLMYRARYFEAAKHAEEWLALARELGDARYEAIALFWLGLQFMNLHDYPKAEALMAESVRTVPPGDEGTLVTARAHQALVWWWGRGEADRARNVMTEVLRYYRETGFEFGIATVQLWLGNINLLCGDLNAARACYAESVSVLYRLGAYQRIVHPIAGAAALAAADGQGVRAITLWAAADALRAAMGSADLSMAHKGYLARIAAAKSEMTSDAREAAEAAGRVMTVTQAVAYVLAD